jgi:transcriptional/translational regulatory protein YebC/TACO1
MSDFEEIRQAIVDAGIEYQSAEIQKIPGDLIKLDGDEARKIIKLMEVLEDLEDVQRVSANFDVPQEILREE